MNLVISQPDAQAILEYLARQPYNEVANFVQLLVNLQESPVKIDPETKETYIDMGGGARMSFNADQPAEDTTESKEETKQEKTD